MTEVLNAIANALPANLPEVLGTLVAGLLTCAVLSYIFGKNPVFRFAEYLFVGVAAGYATAIAWNSILWPRILLLVQQPETYWYYAIYFILGLMLLMRGIKPLVAVGNLPLGVLFGGGAALALGGALTGTLLPQLQASITSVRPLDYGPGLTGWAYAVDAALLVFCTIAALSAFRYIVPKSGSVLTVWHKLWKGIGDIGRAVIMVGLGALLAGAFLSFFTILISRLDYILHTWLAVFGITGL